MCSVLVVAIHAGPLKEYGKLPGFIASQYLPRIAVPFFFATAGYYFIKEQNSEKRNTEQYVLRLLKLYLIWTVFYLLVGINRALQTNGDVGKIFKQLFSDFLFVGSVTHLWFFPAIIISVIITSIAKKTNILNRLPWIAIALYLIGCLGNSYSSIGKQIPILAKLYTYRHFTTIRRILMMGLPFFTMGYFLSIRSFYDYTLKRIRVLLPLSIVLWTVEIIAIRRFSLGSNIIITPFLYVMLLMVLVRLLYGQRGKYGTLAGYSKIAANFMYYAHPFFMSLVTAPRTLRFLIVIVYSLIGGFVIYKANSKTLNRLVM